MDAITINGLSKQYNKKYAIENVSLQVAEGEIFGFIGPNGAGKSTLMKILTGILPQTDGTIEIEGRTEEHYNTKLAKNMVLPVHIRIYLFVQI